MEMNQEIKKLEGKGYGSSHAGLNQSGTVGSKHFVFHKHSPLLVQARHAQRRSW